MSEWISVKNKLPLKTHDVIFLDTYGDMYVGFFMIDYWEGVELGELIMKVGYERIQLEDVTHWMPLPNPPEND